MTSKGFYYNLKAKKAKAVRKKEVRERVENMDLRERLAKKFEKSFRKLLPLLRQENVSYKARFSPNSLPVNVLDQDFIVEFNLNGRSVDFEYLNQEEPRLRTEDGITLRTSNSEKIMLLITEKLLYDEEEEE